MLRVVLVCLSVCVLVRAQPIQPGGGGGVDVAYQNPFVENPEDQGGPMNDADFLTAIKDKNQVQETLEIGEVYPQALELKEKQAKRLETVKERVAQLGNKDSNKRDEMVYSMLHELVGIAHDVAQGLRFEDNHYVLRSKDGKLTDEYEYFDGKGNYTSNPPQDTDYAPKLTRLLKLLSTMYCDASTANAKEQANPIHSFCKLSKDLLESLLKVASAQGFSPTQGLTTLKNVLKNAKTKYADILKVVDDPLLNANAFLEEKASSGIRAAIGYKIAPLGSHHESIACQSLRPALLNFAADPTFVGAAATAGGKAMVPIFDETVGAHTWCDWGVAPSARFWDVNANNLYYLKLGARWQDVPCHGSDALAFRSGFVDTCYARGVPAAAAGIHIPWYVPLLHNSLAIESHERSKTYYHSMTSAQSIAALPGGAPKDQAAFRNKIITQAEEWLNQAVSYQRGNPKANAFDQKRFFWNLGRTCHMIADSYSCAHTARAAVTHQVIWFQDYVHQNHGHHGTHDSQPTPGVSAGTAKALQDCTAIAKIYAAAARDHLDGIGAAIPTAQAALRNYLTNNVYMFYPGQDVVPASSCCVQSTCKAGGKQCPKPAVKPPAGAVYNICADTPTDINVELA